MPMSRRSGLRIASIRPVAKGRRAAATLAVNAVARRVVRHLRSRCPAAGRRIRTGARRVCLAVLHGGRRRDRQRAARVVAYSLGRALWGADRYIGETEKNLERLFAGVAGQRVILLFDEADALFARRTDIGASDDHYANQEVAYLAALAARYGVVVLLATDLPVGRPQPVSRHVVFEALPARGHD